MILLDIVQLGIQLFLKIFRDVIFFMQIPDMPFGVAASGEEDVHNVTKAMVAVCTVCRTESKAIYLERRHGILVFTASTDTAPSEIAYDCSSFTIQVHFFAWKQQNPSRIRQTE